MRLAVRPSVNRLDDRINPATFYVDPNFIGLTPGTSATFDAGQADATPVVIGTDGFVTIQDALVASGAAPDPDTIRLSVNTHKLDNSGGPILIDATNPVSFVGPVGQTGPAIVVPTTDTADGLTSVIQVEGAGAQANFSFVTLSGGAPTLNIGRDLLYQNGAAGKIDTVVFTGIAFPASDDGYALSARIGSSVSVLNSVFQDFGRVGVAVSNSTAFVQGSTFIGNNGATPIQYGVQVGLTDPNGSAAATINANTFTNFAGSDPNALSAGVYAFSSTGVSPTMSVFGNSFTDGDTGVLVDAQDSNGDLIPVDSSNVTVFANNFSGQPNPAITASQSSLGAVNGANNFYGGGAPEVDGANGISTNVDTQNTFLPTAAPTNIIAATPAGYTLQTGIAANGIVVSPLTLAGGNIGVDYNQQLTATGPNGPFTFAVSSGTLPAGLSLSSTGAITGTPTGPAQGSNFTVTVTDSLGQTATVAYSITIGPAPVVVLTPDTLPNATIGQPYDQAVTATGPSGAYSYAVTSGTLPFGLSLDSATGAITGTPSATGTAAFTITATSANLGTSGSQAYNLLVNTIATPLTTTGGAPGTPDTLTVLNPDGSVRYTLTNIFDGFTGGLNVVTADINGDGISEIIVGAGAGGAPRVKVFDGATGSVLLDIFAFEPTFRGGVSVSAIDGTDAFATGAGDGGAPRIRTFDTAGNTLSDIFAFDSSFRGGVNVALGDVTGDGIADLAAGTGVTGAPRVTVFDGATGAVLSNFFAGDPNARDGVRVFVVNLKNNAQNQLETNTQVTGNQVFDPLTGQNISNEFFGPIAVS